MATEPVPRPGPPRTPEAIERDWYENVYAGDQAPQLTLRALAALVLSRPKPQVYEEYTVPVASGIIAGESLMGVAIALLVVAKVLG